MYRVAIGSVKILVTFVLPFAGPGYTLFYKINTAFNYTFIHVCDSNLFSPKYIFFYNRLEAFAQKSTESRISLEQFNIFHLNFRLNLSFQTKNDEVRPHLHVTLPFKLK